MSNKYALPIEFLKEKYGGTQLKYWKDGVTLAEILLDPTANFDGRSSIGFTPLMQVAMLGDVEHAKILVDRGADVNAVSDHTYESPLSMAAYRGHADMVRLLVDAQADFEHATHDYYTPLMLACYEGHIKAAQILVDSGAQINMHLGSSETPLTLATFAGHLDVTRLLLESRAKINEKSGAGYTPLMTASHRGHTEIVRLLLTFGKSLSPPLEPVNIDALGDITTCTALTCASGRGCEKVVSLLIEHDANMEIGSPTALIEAIQQNQPDIVQFLINSGADVNGIDELSGDTPAIQACKEGIPKALQAIVSQSANLEFIGWDGKTALMEACLKAHHECAIILLEAGADPNHICHEHSALSLMVCRNQLPLIKVLLAKGASPNFIFKGRIYFMTGKPVTQIPTRDFVGML